MLTVAQRTMVRFRATPKGPRPLGPSDESIETIEIKVLKYVYIKGGDRVPERKSRKGPR